MTKSDINKINKQPFSFRIIDFKKDSNIPKFSKNRNNLWVDYGNKNNYPDYLLDVFHNRSNKSKAIINRKAKMCAGNGFETLENVTDSYTNFLKNIYSDDDLEVITSKIAFDLEIFGGFALKISWSNKGDKISKIEYLPYSKVRKSAANDNEFYLSKDWGQYRKNENTPFIMPGFSLTSDKDKPQILYYMESQPGIEYYPIPAYSSTLTWIEADFEISNFHLNAIQNGFNAGFILNFANGIPSQEEMDMAYGEFKKKYTGTDNAGKFILTFSDGADGTPTLIPIELNTTDERFITLAQQIKEEIFIGHEVTSPMLFGVRTEGQLGGRDELKDAMELFQTTYIDYQQRKIENVLNKLLKVNGISEEIKLKQYNIFKNN